MVYAENLLNYPDWKFLLTQHTNDSDEKFVNDISHNNTFFSRILINPQRNYNITDKEIIFIMEYQKQFPGIIFGYEISLFKIIRI